MIVFDTKKDNKPKRKHRQRKYRILHYLNKVFQKKERKGIDRCVCPKHATTNNSGAGHIYPRPAGTSPTLGEDYSLTLEGEHIGPPLQMQLCHSDNRRNLIHR